MDRKAAARPGVEDELLDGDCVVNFVVPHVHALSHMPLGGRQVRERCSGGESVRRYRSSVRGSSGVEGRLTRLTDSRSAEQRGGQREERREG